MTVPLYSRDLYTTSLTMLNIQSPHTSRVCHQLPQKVTPDLIYSKKMYSKKEPLRHQQFAYVCTALLFSSPMNTQPHMSFEEYRLQLNKPSPFKNMAFYLPSQNDRSLISPKVFLVPQCS